MPNFVIDPSTGIVTTGVSPLQEGAQEVFISVSGVLPKPSNNLGPFQINVTAGLTFQLEPETLDYIARISEPDVVAPILSNVIVTPASSTASLSADSDTTEGTAYWVVAPSGAAVPTADQVIAGTDGDDNPGIDSGSVAVISSPFADTITGLSFSTDYVVYLTQVDDGGNKADVVSEPFTSAPPPVSIDYTALGNAVVTADGSSFSFTGKSLGSAAADKYIIGSVELRAAGTSLTTLAVSVDGISAVMLGSPAINNFGGNTSIVQFFFADLTADPNVTGDIVVTTGGVTALRCGLQWGMTSGGAPALSDIASDTVLSGAVLSVVLDVPDESFVLAAHLTTSATSNATTWSLANENGDTVIETNTLVSQGHENFTVGNPSLTVSCSINNLPDVPVLQAVAIGGV